MSKIALLFIAVFAYGIYAAIAIGPVWSFYLYELIYFLNPAGRWWGSQVPNIGYSFIIVIVMMGSLYLKRKQHNNSLKDMPEVKWFVAILLSYGIATFVAANPEMHNKYMLYLIKMYIIMYLAYRMIDTERKLELALLFYMAGAAYIGYEAMNVGRNSFGRVEGIGTVDSPEANTIAACIAPIVPLILYFAWQGSIKVKIVTGICAVLVLNGLILINSRGAFLGALVGFSYFIGVMLFSRYKLPKQRLMIALILLGSVVVTIRLVDNTFLERMSTLQDQSIESEGSGGRRMNFWLATFDLLKDYPFGAGIYGYTTLSPIYLNDETYFTTDKYGSVVRAVHSMWFQGLSEIGWLGFGAFIMMLFTLYKHSKNAKKILIEQCRHQQYYLIIAIEGSLLTFLVAGSFINMFRSEILYWLLLFSICASVIAHRTLDHDAQSNNKAKSRL